MSRRYRRRSYRSGKGGNPLGLLVLLAVFFLIEYWEILLLIAVVAVAVILLRKHQKSKEAPQIEDAPAAPKLPEAEPVQPVYTAKDSIMTECERGFFEAIRKIVEPAYTVQPQVNLASVVNKESQSRYRNELFRNIDFGIFDRDYRLRVLIEINDQTHTTQDRRERDQRVKAICDEAGIPLVALWTKYGINEGYIRERLAAHLELPAQPAAEDQV